MERDHHHGMRAGGVVELQIMRRGNEVWVSMMYWPAQREPDAARDADEQTNKPKEEI